MTDPYTNPYGPGGAYSGVIRLSNSAANTSQRNRDAVARIEVGNAASKIIDAVEIIKGHIGNYPKLARMPLVEKAINDVKDLSGAINSKINSKPEIATQPPAKKRTRRAKKSE